MIIREENLEYISRIIGDCYSGHPLSEKLKKIGVPTDVVVYPNTKWRMVFDAMKYCSSLEDENKALKLLGKIIELAVHPLNFATTDSIEKSAKLISDFNKRLAFDKIAINELDGEYRSPRRGLGTLEQYPLSILLFRLAPQIISGNSFDSHVNSFPNCLLVGSCKSRPKAAIACMTPRRIELRFPG